MKKEDFKLRSLSIKSGVVTVSYSDNEYTDIEVTERRLKTPHPDLKNCFQMLNTFIARSTHLDALDVVRGFIEGTPDKAKAKVFLAQMQEHQTQILDSIDVRGISVKGENDKIGVVISGVLSVKGQSTAINTPRIALSRSIFGFEQGLAESIDELSAEVYEYLFAGKEAQQQIAFEEDANDEPFEEK